MNNITPDPEVTNALNELPTPPPHGEGFWDELDTSLTAVRPTGGSRRPFLAAIAAAAAVIVGVLGFVVVTDDDSPVVDVAADVTTTAPSPEEPSDGTTVPETAAATTATTAPALTTTTTTEATTSVTAAPHIPRFTDRIRSERFHYDVGIPDGFSVVQSDGRGIRLEGPFDTQFELRNVVFGDIDFRNPDQPVAESEVLVEKSTLVIPLYEDEPEGLVDRGVVLEIDQWVYAGGDLRDSRIIRVYTFNDRTIRAEIAWNDPPAAEYLPQLFIDDVRMFNAALDLPECSSFGLDPRPAPAELNAAQTATYDRIMRALNQCDWAEFEALLPADGFSASFGGDEAPDLWQNAEAYGDDVMKELHTTLGFELVVSPTEAVWPKAFTQDWADVSDAAKQELRDAGYDERAFDFFTDIGYAGYRTGIDTDGEWNFFITGD